MKKFLMGCAAVAALALPGIANAADLAVRAPVAVAPAVSWTGCYIGFHAGAGWGDKWWEDQLVQDNVSYGTSGWVGGAQLGCDYQAGPLVIGIEGDWSWTNLEGNGAPANLPFGQFNSSIDWIASAGARAGFVADKALIYVKLAAAWADESHTLYPNPAAGLPSQTLSDTRFGVLLGAGIEYMIAPILSAKIEYNYIDFGSTEYFFNQIPGQVAVNNEQQTHVLKLGVNYRFGGVGKAPVVAKY